MQHVWLSIYSGRQFENAFESSQCKCKCSRCDFENTTTPHCCEKPFQHILIVICVVNTQFLTTFWEITLNSTVTQKPFQHIQIVICVLNTRFGILQRHSGEKPFQHIIIVIGLVNYIIPDKVLGHIAEKPVRHIWTAIGVTQFLTAFWDHIEFQRDQSTLYILSFVTQLSWDEWS